MKNWKTLKEKLEIAALRFMPKRLRDERLCALLTSSAPVSEVEKLIKAGADVNAGRGQPLAIAIRQNSFDYLHLLARHGVDVNIAGGMPLRLVMTKGTTAMAFELVRYGADVDAARTSAVLKGENRESMLLEQWVRQSEDSIRRIERAARPSIDPTH